MTELRKTRLININSYPILEQLDQEQLLLAKKFVFVEEEFVPCALCDEGSKFKLLFTSDRYGIKQSTVICRKCGLVFANPRGTETQYGHFYESNLYRLLYEGRDKIENLSEIDLDTDPTRGEFLKFLEASQIDFNTVLDIGAGYGNKLYQLSKLGKKTFGLEPSIVNCNFMKSKGLIVKQGFVGDIQNIVRDKFDLVILSHVLEHLHNPVKSLLGISHILKKYIYIEVPGFNAQFQSIQNAHLFYFSVKSLSAICEKANLKIIKIEQSDITHNIYLIAIVKSEYSSFSDINFPLNEYKNIMKIYYKYIILNFIRSLLKIFGLFNFAKKVVALLRFEK
jgi:SAM-dependent methyltransferase